MVVTSKKGFLALVVITILEGIIKNGYNHRERLFGAAKGVNTR